MANLKDVIYLSAEDYNTLYTNGTVTINGVTLTYDANNVYIVPDDTQQQIDDILAKIPSNASSSNKMLTADDIYAWAKASTKPSYNYSEIGNTPTLATVATSGDYDDLDNKPTIPTIPSNNVTGSGTSGKLAEWNGTNTITNGKTLGFYKVANMSELVNISNSCDIAFVRISANITDSNNVTIPNFSYGIICRDLSNTLGTDAVGFIVGIQNNGFYSLYKDSSWSGFTFVAR